MFTYSHALLSSVLNIILKQGYTSWSLTRRRMQRTLSIVVRFSTHSLLWLLISYRETMKAV